jgi:hypothetical protein
MARTAVPQSKFVGNGNLADPAGTALNVGPGNGHSIAAAPSDRMVLKVTVGATGGAVTVKAGANPPAIAAAQGDLVVAVANSATQWIGPLESGRFIQADGSINVDVAAGVVPGTITAFVLPKAV